MNRPVPPAAQGSATVDLRLDATPAAVSETVGQLAVALARLGMSDDMVGRAQIVLAEVLNNVVEHAYRDAPDTEISLTLGLDGDGLRCVVRDRGVEMPGGGPMVMALTPPDPDRIEDLPEGGFGWLLVSTLAGSLDYERRGDENVLTVCVPAEG